MTNKSEQMLMDYSQLNETLLASWLRLSTSVNNSRFVSEMSYNESLICSILYKHQISSPDSFLTATDLCQMTKMLKSQMNRILNQLEKKNMIIRTRSTKDKRNVFISFNFEQAKTYEKQHKQILEILDHIVLELGQTTVEEAIALFNKVSDIADRLYITKGGQNND